MTGIAFFSFTTLSFSNKNNISTFKFYTAAVYVLTCFKLSALLHHHHQQFIKPFWTSWPALSKCKSHSMRCRSHVLYRSSLLTSVSGPAGISFSDLLWLKYSKKKKNKNHPDTGFNNVVRPLPCRKWCINVTSHRQMNTRVLVLVWHWNVQSY